MTHGEIWRAIDALAAEKGMSASGLARRAGLDPTTFNRSKRHMPDGRARWPTTESLAKVLGATGTTLEIFSHLIAGSRALATGTNGCKHIPLIGMEQAGEDGYFDTAGFPIGGAWDNVNTPNIDDPHTYALEIAGNSMTPIFRDGDIVIVSPKAAIKCGDRIILRTVQGGTVLTQLIQRSADQIEISSLDGYHADMTFTTAEVVWAHRIVWVRQ